MLLIISALLFCAFAWATASWGSQSVTLAWDPSLDPLVTGYVVYWGKDSASLTSSLDVGPQTQATITGLTEGTTNYFAVAAYVAGLIESPPSSPIAYLVPGVVLMGAVSPSGAGVGNLSFPVVPGHWYEVEASADLRTWTTNWTTPVMTSNAWVSFQDPLAATTPRRFYRLGMH